MQQAYAILPTQEDIELYAPDYKPVQVFVTKVAREDKGFTRVQPQVIAVVDTEQSDSKASVVVHDMVKQPTPQESRHIQDMQARAALHQYHKDNQPMLEKIAEIHWSRVLATGVLLFLVAMLIGPLSGPISQAIAAL